jgi:hypothetical protein
MRDRIVADRGGRDRISDLEYDQIENASLTSTILRSLQCRWLKKEQISPDERALVGTIATTQNTYNRIVEMVGAARVPRDVTPSVTDIVTGLNAEAPAAPQPGPEEASDGQT